MFAEERQQKIYDIICKKRSVKVSELSKMLNISAVTIRRDLDELQKQNRIIRTHGGAMVAYSVGRAIKWKDLISQNSELKQKIAHVAYDQICEHDTILLDSSSTVYELVKLIAQGNKGNLRIITTSILAVQALSNCKNCNVMIVGGDINYNHDTVEGCVAARFIKDIRVDKCFIGINGIDEKFGFSTPRYEDAEIKSSMIASSVKSFILADHTKFGKVYLAKVDPCSCLITDCKVPDFSYNLLEKKTDIIFADETVESGGESD
jgi:Bacterial regulatory proteins, deoR family./DeoR-like helix-turn-helix domain.